MSNPDTPPSSSGSKSVVVLGMHRSGTSALMRVLNLLGVALGSNMMIPTADNERGYWEEQEINNIHIVIMKALGRAWSDLSDLPKGWLRSKEISEPATLLREIIKREFANAPLWGVKDPRICLLVPLWLELFESAHVDPGFVLIVRNPMEVAQSIAKRDGISESRGMMIWLRHVLTAEHDTRGQKRLVVGYPQLLDNWRRVVDRISHDLHIAWPVKPDSVEGQINAFLEPSLRKHRVNDKVFLQDASVPELVRRAYSAYLTAADGNTESFSATLDVISAELTPKTPLSAQAMEAVELDNSRLRELLEQNRLTSESQQAQLRADLQNAQQRAAALEQQIASLATQTAEAQQAIVIIESEKQTLHQRSEQDRQLAQSQQTMFADELEKLRSQGGELSEQLMQTRQLLKQAKDDVARAEIQMRVRRPVHEPEIRARRREEISAEGRNRRVLFISHGHPSFRPGGAEIYAWEVYQGFGSSESYEPLFLAKGGESYAGGRLPHPGTNINADERDPNLYFLHTGPDNYDMFLGVVRAKAAIIEDYPLFLRTHRPDVVHFQHTVFLGYDMIRQTRNVLGDVPIVYTLHEYMPICNADGQMLRRNNKQLCTHASTRRCHECFPANQPQDFFIREQFIKSHLALVDLFVAPSRFLMERYIQWGIPREKICYEENGRNLPPAIIPETPAPRPRNRLAFFGQLNPYKGIDLLLRAMKILEKEPFETATRPLLSVHGANLEIQQSEFAQRIRELLRDTDAHVTFCGPYKTNRLPEIMAEVDWVVVPSIWWENAPLVIQEAFHYGKPVICSDIGGMAEKVRDGVDGLHFQVSDAESLARCIRRAVTTPGLWETLQENIRPVHSIEHHVRNLSAMYDALSDAPSNHAVDTHDLTQMTISARVNS